MRELYDDARIRIIIGHYGSGKTEFACNYAIELAKYNRRRVVLADLDIVNPYFRSRERADYLTERGVEVLSSILGNDIGTDLPAISAAVYGPLQNKDCDLILDVGGDKVGARVLRQYNRFIEPDECDVFAVINANRPETKDIDGVLGHIRGIEFEAQLSVTGLINNTHMLWDTSMEDVMKGQKLLFEVSDKLGIPIVYVSTIRSLADEARKFTDSRVLPVDMIMRDSWM